MQAGDVFAAWHPYLSWGTVLLLSMSMPRLATVSLVRNEADIIETFVRHNAVHAVRMVFVLHRCIDNTKEILERLQAEGFPIELHEEMDPGYLQSSIVSGRLGTLARQGGAEWLMSLDADEFLVAAEGKTVTETLAVLGTDRVQLLAWKTYVPTPEDNMSDSNPLQRIVQRRNAENPPIRKVLIPAEILRGSDWHLAMGCHELTRTSTGEVFPAIATASIGIAHFPVRTPEQFMGKILGGWAALLATPGCDPRKVYHWHALAERCVSGRPLSLGELRNIALRYASPEGMLSVPGLVYDPVPTSTHRPHHLIRTASPTAVLMDSALACATKSVAFAETSDATPDPLMTFVRDFRRAVDRIRHALLEEQSSPDFPAVADTKQHEEAAYVFAIALCAAMASHPRPLEGSALARRQTLGSLIAILPPERAWIRSIVQAGKLPLAIEGALQELIGILQRQDFPMLRQQCRKEWASDDVALIVSQMCTADLRPPVPLSFGTFLSQAVHTLLKEETGMELGIADPRVRVTHLSSGRGELAGEFLRRMVNAGIERGANPDALRHDVLGRMHMEESSPILRAIATARLSALLQALRMPLSGDELLPISADAQCTDDARSTVSVICAALGEDVPVTMNAAAHALLSRYLHALKRNGMERDAVASPALRGIACVHALLQKTVTGIGAVIAPRSLLHGYAGSGMREALLEHFEHIRIVDLHGEPSEGGGDEPLDGADHSGLCLLLLVRAPSARQKTLFMEWKGLKLQKYHALLSRALPDLPWQVIAPDKPGYVFLP